MKGEVEAIILSQVIPLVAFLSEILTATESFSRVERMVLRELHYSINILLRMPPARAAYLYFIRAAINGKIFAKYLLQEHKSGRMYFQKCLFRQKR